MLRRILRVLVTIPVGIALVVIGVINRHDVDLVLDPFRAQSSAFALTYPLSVYLFGAFFIGILVGGATVWMNQRHWRKSARTEGRAARRWQTEADRLTRERDDSVSNTKQLLTAGE